MSSGCYLPQINLGVHGGIQGGSHIPYSNFRTVSRTFELGRFNVHLPPLLIESSVAPGIKTSTRRPRVRNHNHNITVATSYI
ncbi:hypothetical protein TNCV_1439561 [Trichonephila clavipes]|nr:hypothetical protein TNCV_1439561 [Trichonephila clavipes]